MTIYSEQEQKLIDEMILFHSDIQMVICRPCQSVLPADLEGHYRGYHKSLPLRERQLLEKYVKELTPQRPLKRLIEMYSAYVEMEEIEGLSLIDGYKCDECGELGMESTIKKHCQKFHGQTLTDGNGSTIES